MGTESMSTHLKALVRDRIMDLVARVDAQLHGFTLQALSCPPTWPLF